MIKTKSIYHDPSEPADGYRLLVMRYWPRGVRKTRVDGWLKDLAPSKDLLAAYRGGKIDWPTFATSYEAQVTGTDAALDLLEHVKGLEEVQGTVTLICHEDLRRSDTHCHRVNLKGLLDLQPLRVTAPGRGVRESDDG